MRYGRIGVTALAVVATLAVTALGASASARGMRNSSRSARATVADSGSLSGAGSTLIAPMVAVWTPVYHRATGTSITYGAIGSGGGIQSITGRTVDFGASDAPLSSAQETACKQCLEIPWGLAGISIAYNVKGVPSGLHFTGTVLADIWLGKITRWNAAAIRRLNPGVKLPGTKIVPVHRTDGSGDTYGFVNYEDHVSSAFRAKLGAPAVSVAWPGGVGGTGNSGVGGVLSSTNGSIGYITFAYVAENHFHYGLVKNAAGRFVGPKVTTIEAAAAALKHVPKGGRAGISIVDPPASAPRAYPISTFTYVLIPKATRGATGRRLKQFVAWAVTTGQKYGPKLVFAPLPKAVVRADRSTLAQIK